MTRAPLRLRWSWRDLRSRWLLVVAIALLIAMGTGLYTGLGSMASWRKESNDASFARLHAHDLRATLTEGSYAPAGRLAAVARSVPGVGAARARLVLPTQVDASFDRRTVLTPGRIVGVSVTARGAPVDDVTAERGRTLGPADARRPVAVVERAYARDHQLPAAGRLRVAGGRELRFVGQGSSPEYFLVTRPGGGDFGAAESSFGVLFVPLAEAQRLAGRPGAANDLVLRLRPGTDARAAQRGLKRALRAAFPRLGFEITTLADEPAHRILYKDAEGDQEIYNIFAFLILGGAALATFNLASRIVEAQRREIGVQMALGVRPRAIAVRPLLLGAEIALAGAVLGVLVGLLAGDLFRGALADLLPLPEIRTPFEPAVFIRGALLGFVLPFVATAIPVWRAVRVRPVEAIRVGLQSARGGRLMRLLKPIHIPGRSLTQMPLRNVLRTPRRTLMTALGIAAIVTVVVALLGMIDSFLATVDRTEREVGGPTPARMVVTLDGFHSRGSDVVRRVASSPAVARVEPGLALPGKLSAHGHSFDVRLGLIDRSSRIWRPTVTSGAFPRGRPGIVIAEKAARDLGVGVGDWIVLRHPRRGGLLAFAEVDTRVRVAGLHPSPFRGFAYLDGSQAAAMGLAGQTDELDVTPAPGASSSDVVRALFGQPGVASVEAATASTKLLRDRMDDFVGILRVTEVFALLLAVLIAFNSTSIAADERARESATMFAFGVPVREAVGLSIGEALIVGLLATLAGVAGGLALLGWVVNETLPRTLPDLGIDISIAPGSLVVAAVVGIGAVALAPLLTSRRLRRMDVPSTLRVVE